MKTLRNLFICLLIMTAPGAFADEGKFAAAMEKGLALLKGAASPDEFQLAANHFERIAAAESNEWLPLYYAAYANLYSGLSGKDNVKQDALYDKALSQLGMAEGISKDNSEILAMQGYVVLMKLAIDPMGRGRTMMPEGMALLGRAKQLNPENPRTYLVEGQFMLFMPEAFGGGKAAAKPILAVGSEKYSAEVPVSSILPQWGKERLEQLLKMCEEK